MRTTLAGDLGTKAWVGDVARVHEILGAVEIVSAVQKEGATLRVIEAEGVIDIELRAIRFHL